MKLCRWLAPVLLVALTGVACGGKSQQQPLIKPAGLSRDAIRALVPFDLLPASFSDGDLAPGTKPGDSAYFGYFPRDIANAEVVLMMKASASRYLPPHDTLRSNLCVIAYGPETSSCPVKTTTAIQAGDDRAAYTMVTENGVRYWTEAFIRNGMIVQLIILDDAAHQKLAASVLTAIDQKIQALAKQQG